MNLIIAGSRSFNYYELLEKEVTIFIEELTTKSVTIVCGMADGADKLGYRYAKEHNLNIIEMHADWEHFKKSAGYIRNAEMGKISDTAIIFWNGSSNGTKNMIDIIKKLNKPCKILLF